MDAVVILGFISLGAIFGGFGILGLLGVFDPQSEYNRRAEHREDYPPKRRASRATLIRQAIIRLEGEVNIRPTADKRASLAAFRDELRRIEATKAP